MNDVDAELFGLLAQLRGANANSLHALHFKRRDVPYRTMMRRLAVLVEQRQLARTRLRGARSIYHLTASSLAAIGSPVETLRRPPPERQAAYCWLRSCLWAAFTNDRYSVGRGNEAVYALRRFLVDGARGDRRHVASGDDPLLANLVLENLRAHPLLRPMWRDVCVACDFEADLAVAAPRCRRCRRPTRARLCRNVFRCGRCELVREGDARAHGHPLGGECAGRLAPADLLPFDLAYRKREATYDVVALFVDNPSRPLAAQLAELPQVTGQPRLPVLVRSVDPDSRLDTKRAKWLSIGRRHRALLHAFEHPSASLNLASTSIVVDPYPSVHVHGF